jgi:hypothetical protein
MRRAWRVTGFIPSVALKLHIRSVRRRYAVLIRARPSRYCLRQETDATLREDRPAPQAVLLEALGRVLDGAIVEGIVYIDQDGRSPRRAAAERQRQLDGILASDAADHHRWREGGKSVLSNTNGQQSASISVGKQKTDSGSVSQGSNSCSATLYGF